MLRGQMPPQTAHRSEASALRLNLRRTGASPSAAFRSLFLYDVSGEDFETSEGMQGHHFGDKLDGILFLIDPFAEASVLQSIGIDRFNADAANPARQSAATILENFIGALERRYPDASANMPFPIPLVAIVTKIDQFQLASRLGIPTEEHAPGDTLYTILDRSGHISAVVRNALKGAGMGTLVKTLEMRFAKTHFVPV